jgi:transposase
LEAAASDGMFLEDPEIHLPYSCHAIPRAWSLHGFAHEGACLGVGDTLASPSSFFHIDPHTDDAEPQSGSRFENHAYCAFSSAISGSVRIVEEIRQFGIISHSLLLSDQGTPIKDIAKTYHVDRDTVSSWLTKWEHHGAQSLHDKPRSGRPSKLTPDEQALAQQYIKEEPRALKRVVECLATKTAKRISISSLKRLAKKARLRWKRVRKSLKRLREPDAFARCQRELEALQQQEDTGKIDLYYFDESGFALDPTIPYAWQEPGSVIELPAMKYGRINVLGFMNRHNDLHSYMFEQSIHTGVVIGCFDAFCQTITKKTVVIMDNASIHTSEEFEHHIPYWKK